MPLVAGPMTGSLALLSAGAALALGFGFELGSAYSACAAVAVTSARPVLNNTTDATWRGSLTRRIRTVWQSQGHIASSDEAHHGELLGNYAGHGGKGRHLGGERLVDPYP